MDELAEIQAARVHECQQRDHRQADELCCGERERIAAKTDRFDEIVRLRHPRDQNTGVTRKPDSDRRDCAGLYNEKERPAVEKTPQRRERFAQINILPPGLRHHGRQLAIRERGHKREQAGDEPDNKQPAGRANLPGDD